MRLLKPGPLILLALTLLSNAAWAKLYSDPAQLPSQRQYDYIVVGGSPGGCVMASRLSEDPNTTVLLVEAGPSDIGVLGIEIPLLAGQLQPNTAFDWNYTTVPQKNLNNRVVQLGRGHVLGGGSSINFMVYTRGPRDDFDKYAAASGDNGWSWNALQPYWKKLERLVPPVDHHNTTGQINPAIHGTTGPLNISLPGAPLPADPRVINTTRELPQEFPFNLDMNSGNPLGIGWQQGTYGNGIRMSGSSAYIQPVLSRQNLDVLVGTTVTKLVQTGKDSTSGKPVFLGVKMAQSKPSPVFSLTARKEVILAAGTINTPQLLMISGLGPTRELSSLGIPTIVNLPDVGQHLVDHPLLTNPYSVAGPQDDLLDNLTRNATLANDAINQWITQRQGVMVISAINQVGWLRIPKNDTIWQKEVDPSSGPTAPHLEILFNPGFLSLIDPLPATGSFMTFLTMVVSPTSRGTVTLASVDPFSAPVIDPNYFNTTFDISAMRAGVRAVSRIVSAPTWQGYITGQASAFTNVDVTSDDQLDAWARSQASTIWHPVSTARMGKCEAADPVGNGSVVNPDLTVKGVKGLRIVDASVLPFIPAAHPQAAVYVFAERVADLIRKGKSSC